uniref:Uncharacterized protein n=1 Tax=Romanomermis culicivorax TaxID=13658 RepID=A0A915JL97_ROMCU
MFNLLCSAWTLSKKVATLNAVKRKLQRAQMSQQLTKAGNPGHPSKQEVDKALQALIDIKIKAALEGAGQGLCVRVAKDDLSFSHCVIDCWGWRSGCDTEC